MSTVLDVSSGEEYELQIGDRRELVRMERELPGDRLLFISEETRADVVVQIDEFEDMRSDGRAIRRRVGQAGHTYRELEDFDPLAELDPDDPKISGNERAARIRARKRLAEARTLRFYAIRYDEDPSVGRGDVGMRRFIQEHWAEAQSQGLTWKPSQGALRRALNTYGEPGHRPLNVFLNRRGRHARRTRWPSVIVDAAEEMVASFWSPEKLDYDVVIANFFEKVTRDEEALVACGAAPSPRPEQQTLRRWILAEEDYDNVMAREGSLVANARFKGRGRSLEATRPGELVQIDHTMVDGWAVLRDENGAPILVERPWMTVAVDVYSRMTLGAVFTFEHPSVYSAMLCLRDVIRRKTRLIDRFGAYKGATDGYIKPSAIIVDNGWEFTGASFQALCEGAGIDVIWAPIKCPQYKAIVERLFETFNKQTWHRMKSGIPFKPHEMSALGLNPMKEAAHGIDEFEDFFWNGVVTIYHVEVHSGIKMAPARRWSEGLGRHRRQTIDDVTALDAILGKTQSCLLTVEGVRANGQRFHDPAITSELLNRLARFGAKRSQRKGRLSSATVKVRVTIDPGDCGFVHVWDQSRKKQVRLPNWDANFSRGCSWAVAKKIAEFAKDRNLAFHSDAEKYAARAAHSELVISEAGSMPFRTARRHAPQLDAERKLLPDAVDIYESSEPASVDGDRSRDVTVLLPMREREGDQIPPTGRRRGGKAATAKATRTRKENRRKAEAAALPHPASKKLEASVTRMNPPQLSLTPDERMALLAKDLDL